MTMAEFAAFMDGFRAFHAPAKDQDTPTDAEYIAALAEERMAGQA